ncbi:MAG: DNA repair protein RecO [Candidatus Aminicenantaceae bacterium]
MPLKQSEAIILRYFDIGEQDRLVVFFSKDEGIIKGIAKGARKFGNRFGSSLEPFSLVCIFYYEKEKKDLVTISNCDLIDSFFEIQSELNIYFNLCYFAEVIEEFLPLRSKEDKQYRLLLSLLRAIKNGADINFLARYFEAWTLKISGFLPDLNTCKSCRKPLKESGWLSEKKDGAFCHKCAQSKKEKINPELIEFLRLIKKNPPSKTEHFPFSSQQIDDIGKILQSIIVFHLEKEPKSLRFLRSISFE